VGARLEAYLRHVAARPIEGSLLAGLNADCLQWRKAGERLREATLRMSEGKPVQWEQSMAGLPIEVQRSLMHGPGP
jgi:hypothetical protein